MSGAARSYLAAGVAAREQTRRRRLLLGVAALLLASTSPVFGHHLAGGVGAVLAGSDHWGELCVVALHLLLAPVHYAFHALLVLGLAYAAWDRARVWWRVRRTVGLLETYRPEPGDPFWTAAERAGVDPRVLRVVDGLPNPAFTAGWLRPRIYVAGALAAWLSPAELTAVLAHEGAHVRRRDPLRLSLLRFVACTLFWLPALRRIAQDVADEAEIDADDRAAGDAPLVLASALLLVATRAAVPLAATPLEGAVGFACHDLLERRIRRLAGEAPSASSHVTRRSVAAALVALFLVWISGAVMAHPLPPSTYAVGAHAEHCLTHRVAPWLHLLCPPLGRDERHCRHDVLDARAVRA